MIITAQKVLDVARAELGYHEKASNANLDDKTANSGSGNYTKYARDLFRAGYYNGNKNGYAWCDVGVDWCFYMAAGKDANLAQKIECQTGPFGAGCAFSAQYYQAKGRWSHDPSVGAQVFFLDSTGNINHTGLVESCTSASVTCIEFNVSDMVARRTYMQSDVHIAGYGLPLYDQEFDTGSIAKTPYTIGKTIAETIFNFCIEVLQLTTAAACGVLANIQEESGFQIGVLGDAGTSYGICQWHASRYTSLLSWCSGNGRDYSSLDGQLWYMKHELETTHKTTLDALRAVPDTADGAYEAGRQWCLLFEVPKNKEEKAEQRGNIAQSVYWPKYATGAVQTAPASPVNSCYSGKTFDLVDMPVLMIGCLGNAVVSLQMLLISHGYGVGSDGADGDFGRATYTALINYQTEKGLEIDGVAGAETYYSLLGVR